MALVVRLLKWVVIGVGCLVIAVLLGGAVYQVVAESRDRERFPPPGRLVDVDGRLMHLHCRGLGSPTVVVEQGLNGVAASWDEIHQRMALVTRVCMYDRAGLGYSEPLGHPTRAPEVADRLHLLLDRAEIDDALVLVGWSAGGVYVREFHRRHRENVRAMLLVDSSHEQQANRIPSSPGGGSDSMLKVARALAPFGLVRLSGMVKGRFSSFRGPEELKARLVALYEQSHVVSTMLRESEAFNHDIAGSPPAPLGDLPLIVLSRGEEPADETEPASAEERELQVRKREARRELQRELAALSSRGKQIVATESGHAIQYDQPDLLIESIEELVRSVRAESEPLT